MLVINERDGDAKGDVTRFSTHAPFWGRPRESAAALAADAVHRDDVRVVQAGGGLGLDLEPLDLPSVQGRREKEDLVKPPTATAQTLRERFLSPRPSQRSGLSSTSGASDEIR